jgi:hypothetical protein
MEDNNLQESIGFAFLKHPDAKELFAPLDYALKNGKHIQKQSQPTGTFNYIGREFESLHAYYKDYFGLYLRNEGQDSEQYFFIDFQKDYNGNVSRGKIPIENREYLKDEYILVALLLIRLYIIDFVPEYRHTVDEFKKRLLRDYDEYKFALFRLLVDSEDAESSSIEEDAIGGVINRALKEFHKIGWIEMNDETNDFEIMPSCKRLLSVYEESIQNIESILKETQTNPDDQKISSNI